MSLTNGERLIRLETQMGTIKDDVSEIKSLLKQHISDEKDIYAGRWVEKTLIGTIIAIAGSIAALILGRL